MQHAGNNDEFAPQPRGRQDAEDALLTTAFLISAVLFAALPFVLWWSPEIALLALIGSFTALALRAMVRI